MRSEGKGWIDASVRWDNTNQWDCGKSSIRKDKESDDDDDDDQDYGNFDANAFDDDIFDEDIF